eukprot:1186764-Prorocentrum_minimum.AAC.3
MRSFPFEGVPSSEIRLLHYLEPKPESELDWIVHQHGAPLRGPGTEKLRAMVSASDAPQSQAIDMLTSGDPCWILHIDGNAPTSSILTRQAPLVRGITESNCKGDAVSFFSATGFSVQFSVLKKGLVFTCAEGGMPLLVNPPFRTASRHSPPRTVLTLLTHHDTRDNSASRPSRARQTEATNDQMLRSRPPISRTWLIGLATDMRRPQKNGGQLNSPAATLLNKGLNGLIRACVQVKVMQINKLEEELNLATVVPLSPGNWVVRAFTRLGLSPGNWVVRAFTRLGLSPGNWLVRAFT